MSVVEILEKIMELNGKNVEKKRIEEIVKLVRVKNHHPKNWISSARELHAILLSEELFEHLTTYCGFPVPEGNEQIPPFIHFFSRYLGDISVLEDFFDFMEHKLIYNSWTEDINQELRNIALLYRYINFQCFFTEERERALQDVKEIMLKHRISINCIIC